MFVFVVLFIFCCAKLNREVGELNGSLVTN